MVATGCYTLKSSQHRDFSTMADVLLPARRQCAQRINKPHLKKDIIVKSNDVSDIVEKFIKVVNGPEALENNRARENARENIRKKLALEAAKEKSDSCDLQICFMNEFASDEDLSESKEDIDPAALAGEEIAKANISQKVSQIIVPLSPGVDHSSPNQATLNTPQEEANSNLRSEVSRLQKCAQDSLMKARDNARLDIQDRSNTRQQTNQKLFSLVGLPQFSKVNYYGIFEEIYPGFKLKLVNLF